MGANSNFFNVRTIIFVVVTRGPKLKGIERDSMDKIPSTVPVGDIEEGLKTVGLCN